MSDILRSLASSLSEKRYEAFLNALCVNSLERAYDPSGQGILNGSSELDNFCCQAAEAIAADFPHGYSEAGGQQDLTIYIATDLFFGRGGHTPLLLDLIKVDCSTQRELILTKTGCLPNSSSFSAQLYEALPSNVKASELQAETLLQKILILREYIHSKNPRRLILVTHQHDVVAYCAVTRRSAAQILYIHHADTLTLGLYIPWYTVVGTNEFGVKAVVNMTGRPMFCWPVASYDHGARPWLEWDQYQGLNTCSHGTPRKFESDGDFDYGDIVAKRLQMLSGTHFHIGELCSERRQKIEDKLAMAGVNPSRFVYVGSVPILWKYLKKSNIQLCISSYPICSPRGLVETKGCAIPILIFEDTKNPTRSSVAYGYPGCLTWRNIDELDYFFENLTPNILEEQSKIARASFELKHSLRSLEMHANLSSSYIVPE
ncbi:hypothetical protein [Rhodoferax aquaticus]|uniref:Glycosyltransferase family 1 protein n=1 Tax=Rhodoferax aquaticus TaxID=2527691 RepID=A0A515EP42_9BURK|nr:hypothetical protein [Rhodoferax aquaticus]QDL54437.1 hypothetical protein EXZ61_09835 [Rhodoferax aquaticus]